MRVLILFALIAVVVIAVAVVIYGPMRLKAKWDNHKLDQKRRSLELRRFENQVLAEEEKAWDERLREDDL